MYEQVTPGRTTHDTYYLIDGKPMHVEACFDDTRRLVKDMAYWAMRSPERAFIVTIANRIIASGSWQEQPCLEGCQSTHWEYVVRYFEKLPDIGKMYWLVSDSSESRCAVEMTGHYQRGFLSAEKELSVKSEKELDRIMGEILTYPDEDSQHLVDHGYVRDFWAGFMMKLMVYPRENAPTKEL